MALIEEIVLIFWFQAMELNFVKIYWFSDYFFGDECLICSLFLFIVIPLLGLFNHVLWTLFLFSGDNKSSAYRVARNLFFSFLMFYQLNSCFLNFQTGIGTIMKIQLICQRKLEMYSDTDMVKNMKHPFLINWDRKALRANISLPWVYHFN